MKHKTKGVVLTMFLALTGWTGVAQVPDYLNADNLVLFVDFEGNLVNKVAGDSPLVPSGSIGYIATSDGQALELDGNGGHLFHPDEGFPSGGTTSICVELRLDQFGTGFGPDLVPILPNGSPQVHRTTSGLCLNPTVKFGCGGQIHSTRK